MNFCKNTFTMNSHNSGQPQDCELAFVVARIRNSQSLFQSNRSVIFIFDGDLAADCVTRESVIALNERWELIASIGIASHNFSLYFMLWWQMKVHNSSHLLAYLFMHGYYFNPFTLRW